VDERRKRVLLIAASILAARKLSDWDGRPFTGSRLVHRERGLDRRAHHEQDRQQVACGKVTLPSIPKRLLLHEVIAVGLDALLRRTAPEN
jgi:hypothetical protein